MTHFILIGIILPLYAYKISQNSDYTDFDVYYRTAVRVKNHLWNQVYTLQDGSSPFRYSPLFIPLFRPFAELTIDQAKLVWFFLQYSWFGTGFYFICLSLRLTLPKPQEALWYTTLGILFILRFCLDTFTIGQVSSLMFLGFSLGLYGYLRNRASLSTAGILIPSLLKIGPAFLFGIFLSAGWKPRIQAVATFLLLTAFLGIASTLWIGISPMEALWPGWAHIVASDSQYYDASHYGSQSLNSVLLRGVRAGWLTLPIANRVHACFAFSVCSGILAFWLLRRPKTSHAQALFYSLGLFPFLWIMPETFKYALTALAIPVVFLFSSPKKEKLTFVSLLFGALVLSLSGKDVVGDWIFFNSQIYNLPFLATLLLGVSTFRLAWMESDPVKIKNKDDETQDGPIRAAITADDWGLSPGVNQGILSLARAGIVKRVSLMANAAYLEDGLKELRSLKDVELGIHFNLTYGHPLSKGHQSSGLLNSQGHFLSSPAQVLIRWLNPFGNRKAQKVFVRQELESQLKRLESVGVPVRHLDGHQHIHLVPGLLDTLADLIHRSGIRKIRLPYDGSLWFSPSKVLIVILSVWARASFRRHRFQGMPFVYPKLKDFQDDTRLHALIAQHPDSEIMVHPSNSDDVGQLEFPDPYTWQRVIEYQALMKLKKSQI